MHHFRDIRLVSVQWLWNPGHSRSSELTLINPLPMTSY